MSRRAVCIAATSAVLALVVVGCSDDSGDEASDGTPVAVEGADTTSGDWYLTPDPTSVAAGPVTFTFDNAGTTEHEMVVLRTDTPFDQLEVTDDRVSEDDSVGEVEGVAGGETGSVTLDLEPGAYVLVCNIAGHYGEGMRSAFEVT